jgi:hypothetical protein
MTRNTQAYYIHPEMTCIVRAYNIHPTAGGPFIDPVREENSLFLVSFKTIEEAKLHCAKNLLKYYNLYYRITDRVADSWYVGHTDTNGVKQLKDLDTIPVILEDIIFDDDPITSALEYNPIKSNHDNNHDIDALTNNVRSLEARIDLLTKEIRDLRDTKKHTNDGTTSSHSESDDGSKPPGWIHPPDGWEWIGAKQEYKQKMTGIRICYMIPYQSWEVVIPPNQTKLWGFVTGSLSYAFENYASYKVAFKCHK